MVANYVFSKNRNTDPANVYKDIAAFFLHIHNLGIDLQAFELKPDGTITVRTRDPIDPDQLAHLGMAP